MRNVIAKFQQARELQAQGQLSRARALYEDILQLQPAQPDALRSLAIVAAQSKDYARAVEYFDKVIAVHHDDATSYCNRGLALQELSQLQPALASFDRALALQPGYALAHFNRGNVLKALGRLEEALRDYDRAIAINAALIPAHYNRGVLLAELERWPLALKSYGQAIALMPNHAEAHYNQGVVLQKLGQWQSSLDSYDRAIRANSQHAEACANRGVVLKTLKQYDAALASFDRALSIKPTLASACFNRGNVLIDLARYQEGIDSFDRAIALGSDGVGLYGSRRQARMQICDWRNFDAETAELRRRIENDEPACTPFQTLLSFDDARLQKQAAETWVRHECPSNASLGRLSPHPRKPRIRLGYFSADFHNHATLYLMAELFEQHDRSRFDIVAFSFGPNTQDAMQVRLQRACNEFHEVRSASDADAALLSRNSQIDIAIDLKGFTQFGRPGIFSRRAAPLQISYLGYPGTMGADYMDYLIADRSLIPPGSELHYSEQIIYLPDSYQVNDRQRRIADTVFSRERLALPSQGFVFCCFNNNFKLAPSTFDLWMRILNRVEGSVLWLYQENPTAAANLRREAAQRGIDPTRLIFATFMDLPEHLARHRAADLFLDTVPCNAHTTASDSLWAGLPVLSHAGETLASRVAASLLTALNLSELIAPTRASYEELAVELAMHPERLHAIRQKLTARRLTTSLFDSELFTGRLEGAYTTIYERCQAGLPCEPLYL